MGDDRNYDVQTSATVEAFVEFEKVGRALLGDSCPPQYPAGVKYGETLEPDKVTSASWRSKDERGDQ